MNNADQQYHALARHILDTGRDKEDRTGTGTRSIFGAQMRFDLRTGFPLLTTKKVFTRGIVHELLWFLKGDTNIKYLVDNGVHIWDEWADANGDLGPVYGSQWRSWPGKVRGLKNVEPVTANEQHMSTVGEPVYETIDQIQQALDLLKNNPDSRRIIVSAWNPAEVPQMKLPPCHAFFQFYTCEMTVAERQDYAADVMGLKGCRIDNYGHASLSSVGVPTRYLDCQLYQRSIH